MNIVVCVKRVPDTSEADIVIDKTGRDIERDDLAFDINEWDGYALEEAVTLKEKLGGTVTAVTIGSEDAEDVLRRCLAVGADNAVHLLDEAFDNADGYATAKALAAAVRRLSPDLVLAGAQAADDGYGQTGPALAQLLGLPHASVVTNLEIDGKVARVHRELEGGLEEVLEITLPAVLTIQTGINEPRYVSIAGIRRVAKREISVFGPAQLGLSREEVGEAGSKIRIERVFLPPPGQGGEMIQGAADAVAEKLVGIFASKGWLK